LKGKRSKKGAKEKKKLQKAGEFLSQGRYRRENEKKLYPTKKKGKQTKSSRGGCAQISGKATKARKRGPKRVTPIEGRASSPTKGKKNIA